MVAGERVTALEHGCHVQLAGDGCGRPAHVPGRLEDLDRAEQCLARHARPVGALAADQLGLHDDSRPVTAGDGVLAGVLSRGAAADDDDVPAVGRFGRHRPTVMGGRRGS